MTASYSINAKVTVLNENVLTCRSMLTKDTHREIMLSNNSQALTKKHEYGHWVIDTLNRLCKEVLILKLNFQKNKVYSR